MLGIVIALLFRFAVPRHVCEYGVDMRLHNLFELTEVSRVAHAVADTGNFLLHTAIELLPCIQRIVVITFALCKLTIDFLQTFAKLFEKFFDTLLFFLRLDTYGLYQVRDLSQHAVPVFTISHFQNMRADVIDALRKFFRECQAFQ